MGVLPKPTVHTDALVLRAWSCGESSAITSLLTREEGFIKTIAKAVRKPGSRLRPLIEPGRLVHVEFSLDPARDLQFLRAGSVNLDPMSHAPSLEKSAFLLGALELIDRCRPLGQTAGHRAEVDLFAVCEEYVRVLSSPTCQAPTRLFFAFEWELLERHGMAPEIEACIGCGEPPEWESGATHWFSPGEGGLVCQGCAQSDFPGKMPLGEDALQALFEMAGQGMDLDYSEPMPRFLRREVGRLLHNFMGYHLPGYRLPSALELLRNGSSGKPGGDKQA